MSTAEQQVQEPISLRDELTNNYESLQSDPTVEDNTPEVETETVIEVSEPEVNEPEPELNEEEGEPEYKLPDDLQNTLDYLPKEDREYLSTLTPEVQETVLKRERERNASLTRKQQENSDTIRYASDIKKIFEPYANALQMQGLTEAQKIGQWAQIDNALSTNPAETLRALAKSYGVELNAPQTEESFVDPLQKQVDDLKRTMETQDSNAQQRIQNEANSNAHAQINTFKNSKDEQGNLLYPHFDALGPSIGAKIQSGEAPDMETAYKQLMSGFAPAPEEKASPRKSVKEAKAAASGVKSSSTTAQKEEPKTLREELTVGFKRMNR